MPKLTPQQLREIYLKLPKNVQDAIFSVDSAEAIQAIGKKYNLAIDKIGELADETGMVMLGMTHPRDFIVNIARRLNLDKETARKIAEDINNQIFMKIRESLKKIHEISVEAPTPRPEPSGVGVPTPAGVGKEEILKEIEKTEDISVNPFEAKTKDGVLRIPPEERKYTGSDPYREPI